VLTRQSEGFRSIGMETLGGVRDMTFSSMIKAIEKRRVAVGKERDKISEMIDELSCLKESCDRAYDDMQSAIDALSEHA